MEIELNKNSVETWLSLIREFLRSFQWLMDSFVLDHFTDSHWEKLPECWRQFLSQLSPAQLSDWILTGKFTYTKSSLQEQERSPSPQPQGNYPAPLTLQAIRKTVEVLSINRVYDPNKYCTVHFTATKTKAKIDDSSNCDNGNKSNRPNPLVIAMDDKLLKLLNRHVKPKKQHEIRNLSAIIQELSYRSGSIKNIIDIGSGLGHLCRFLSYGLGFNTIGIDSDSKLGINAKIFNQEIEKHLSSKTQNNLLTNNKPQLSEIALSNKNENGGNCNKSECSTGIKVQSKSEHLNKFLEKDDKISMFDEFGLVGLHGCGDLGGIIVQNFVLNPQVKFLAFASCCYMKLKDCFPLSFFLQEDPIILKYEPLELSCHAKEIYMERLNNEAEVNKLKTHCYRATLETILQKHGLVREGLTTVKNVQFLPFHEYALRATKNLQINLQKEDFITDEINAMLNDWMKVVYFYTLRVLIAPVIETVVLLDRALLILENGFKCELRPVFDPVKSPRNIVLIGIKPEVAI